MEKTIKSSAVNLGLYLGTTLALITVLIYVINVELLVAWWLGIILFLLILGFGIYSTAQAKSMLNGFISFKEAFSAYFITIAVGVLISVGVTVLLFEVIDKDAAILIQEKAIESTVNMMERFGAPSAEIDKTVEAMSQDNSFSLISQLKSIAYQLLFYSIVGLIVAASMKKKDPELA